MESKETKQPEAIPMDQIPANMRMPEQLTTEELKREVMRLRNILQQADQRIGQLSEAWGLKRIEFLFEILKEGKFDSTVMESARTTIAVELGLIEPPIMESSFNESSSEAVEK